MDILKGQFVRGALLDGRYESLSPLNHGSFGMVFMAKDSMTGRQVAIKCLAKPSGGLGFQPGPPVDDRSEELKIHTHIGFHSNVVNLLDSFETDTHSYLVLEYCSMGDLYEAIRQDKGPKQTDHVRDFMLQLISAVEFLHSMGVYHRDIKPENVFLTDNGEMKIGDFGLATMDAWSYEVAVGSDRYMAPEQFDPHGNGLCPARADIWSVGICLLNILFSRNPFAEPALSDPLFHDFVRDRQSLFDVFPNMSQDTFVVLSHCLALDPEKRSLALARDALRSVISFTVDDDNFDEFCTENRDVVANTVNREPLRTPSVASPRVEQGETFPWAQALHTSPAKCTRQLSAIPDTESLNDEMFPGSDASVQDWNSKADTASLESMGDSGLGVSVGSNLAATAESSAVRSKPLPITGPLPTFGERASNALSSIFGRKKTVEPKSWSDMWDEDEEERKEFERSQQATPGKQIKPAQLSQLDSESEGYSTPRPCLAELNTSSAVNARPHTSSTLKPKDDSISQHTGFVFEDDESPRYSPPSKQSMADRWSKLGEYRRGLSTLRGTRSTDNLRTGGRLNSFNPLRRSVGKSNPRQSNNTNAERQVLPKKQWNASSDWRSDQHYLRGSPLRTLDTAQIDGNIDDLHHGGLHSNKSGWVGGLNGNLHL